MSKPLPALTLVPLALAACGPEEPAAASATKVVRVYSHRHYDSDRALFARFTEETGIQVLVHQGGADEFIKLLESEGGSPRADLFATADAGHLYRAKTRGLLQAVVSPTLEANVPEHLRDPDRTWFGLTKRARILVYSKERVKPEELSTYEALTGPEWKGRILVRSSSNIYNQSLLAAMIASRGPEAAKAWAAGIVANFAREPKGNDRDQIKAVAAGIGDVAIVNSYYLGMLATSTNPEEVKVAEAVAPFFPDQEGRGTHVNVSGAGVTKYAAHVDNAIELIEFLTREEAQKAFARANHEYPVNPRVPASELVSSWGNFKEDTVNMSELGAHNREAVIIFDEVGWR